MRAISEEEARKYLTPHLNKLILTVVESVNDYFNGLRYAAVRHEHSLRTSASVCHDKIKRSVENAFDGVPGTYYRTHRGLFTLVIDGAIALRFKKFNRKNLSVGIETQQLLAFNNQDVEQLEFPDMPPNGLLHIGYRLNKLETGIGGVYVSCRHGNNNLWIWDITEEGTTTTEHVLIPHPEVNVPSRRKITAKGANIGGGEVNAN
ncbi:hypothetical protein [Paenibacillus sp. y28]|uniref:hypothetical protein n=1 Tax=Paenibacillus sp. y28 TaxID=3129110 RepID=UPI003018EBB6